MAFVSSSAPVLFSLNTSASGTSAQILQVSSAGVTAGLTAGNLYLDSASSNLLNGRAFEVNAVGWIKAHGATQTAALGLQIFPWNTTVAGGRTATGTATFTPVASGALTAGTYYDFAIAQKFFGELNADTLTCEAPTVYAAGSQVTISSVASAVTVAFASASVIEPITGINTTTDYPLASFVVSVTNSVSDTVQTVQLTNFSIQLI